MSERAAPQHLYSVDSLTHQDVLEILDSADALRGGPTYPPMMAGKIVCLMFFEPSTRTRVGFDVSVKRLGGATTCLSDLKQDAEMGWSESLEDTLRVVSAYCDAVVVRHPSSAALEHALPCSSVPVINAGSGRDRHPTQALIDLSCIRARLGRLEGLRVGLVGDLAGSRSAKSLVRALAHWAPAELRLMAPPSRSFDAEAVAGFGAECIVRHDRLVPHGLDVLYVAQLPNAPDRPPYDVSRRASLGVTMDTVAALPKHAAILCPLPRLDEIDRAVDATPQAAYFAQSAAGLHVRMATLMKFAQSEPGPQIEGASNHG